ncbi:MAG: N-succinylarginine dihydrolase [Planctomycetota bacterium]
MPTQEHNFDGLVGPTHNYAGLAPGNLHSMASANAASSPRQAVKQGLAKMRALHDLGLPQAVLPPHPRPHLDALRAVGFVGDDDAILNAAAQQPELLAAAFSASGMWTANAATVAPSTDTADARLHLTPANLCSFFHRSIEPPFVARTLRAMFERAGDVVVHDALPATDTFSDEGAANHTRLGASDDDPGVHLFVYGRIAAPNSDIPKPKRFRGRQTLEACQAIARSHQLHDDRVVYAQQSPAAIDAGVFHNDVISVGRGATLLYHDDAFLDTEATLDELKQRLASLPTPSAFHPVRVTREELPLEDVNDSYLFNSQLVQLPSDPPGMLTLIAPTDCRDHPRAGPVAERLAQDDNTIARVVYVDVRQSMRNGGGPACLRLRIPLSDAQRAALAPGVVFSETLHDALNAWADRHYRDQLHPRDLADPALARESHAALTELADLLGLPGLYDA